MALRITTGLIKFKNLQKDLGLSLYATIGLLEALWHFTVSNAIQGDVGKHSNQDIADWIGWEGNADKMIEALTNRRWLDKHSEHRLIVHDWHLHADKSVRTTLKNRKMDFVYTEELTKTPEKNIGIPVLQIGVPPGAGPGPEYGAEYGAGAGVGAGDSAAIKRHSPVEILNPFPEKVRQPALQSAIEYQIRRYQAPMPSATWYPSLLNEAGTLFEVQEDPAKALEIFVAACKTKPTTTLPRDATYSQIAEHCGLKKSRFSGPAPWEKAKQDEHEKGMALIRKAVKGE